MWYKINLMIDPDRAIVEKLRKLLESDRFSSHNRLPPERSLAAELGVSRGVLRKALATLEKEGRIWRHVGQGTFKGPRLEADPRGVSVLTSVTNPTEIMEARLVLEPKLAALAALRATLSELSQMEEYGERSKRAANAPDFEHWDELLHLNIARATDNSLLLSLFMVLHDVRQGDVWGSLKEASLTKERRSVYYQQHLDLIRALKQRDAARAERVMREHLETIKRHLLAGPLNP
jgi:DNA-binding FadR family transcriptional regulator